MLHITFNSDSDKFINVQKSGIMHVTPFTDVLFPSNGKCAREF